MRLKQSTADLIMDNIHLLEYCKNVGIDMAKLRECYIERIQDDYYLFLMQKENMPKSTRRIPLDHDIDTQPDIVLRMEIANRLPKFSTTEETARVAV